MKKDKLYTVSKYSADRINKEAKANLFPYGGGFWGPQINDWTQWYNNNLQGNPILLRNTQDPVSSFSIDRPSAIVGNRPLTLPSVQGGNPNDIQGFNESLSKWQQNNPMGGQQMPVGNRWADIAQAAPGSVMGIVSAFKDKPQYSPDAAGNGFGMVDNLLAGGNKSKVGTGLVNTGASVMNVGLKTNNPWLMLAGGIAGTVGTGINAAFGTKENEKNIKTLTENNARLRASGKQLASATTSDSFIQAAANMGNGTGFRGKDLVTGGWFAGGKAAREANKYLNAEKQALAYQGHAMTQGAQNVDKIQDDNVKANFAAGGGWLNYGDMGALEYGLALDAINARKRNAEIKDRIPNNPFGALAVAPNMFEEGGPEDSIRRRLFRGWGNVFTDLGRGIGSLFTGGNPGGGTFGGGSFSGAGNGGDWRVEDNYVPRTNTFRGLALPVKKRTFNDAYAEARLNGEKTFEFNGKTYSTEYDTSNDPERAKRHKKAGDERKEYGLVGIGKWDHAYGGPLMYEEGGILIKHPGRLTELKKRTGKTEAELWAEGKPDVRKMITFARNARKWQKAYGGFLDAADNLFALGGDIQMHGGDYTTGSTHIDEGGTHEENPNQGVQVGVDPEGTPNLVEEGEIIYNDYVYSQRIELDDEAKEKFHFSKKRDITYADAAKKLEKEISERPNDPLSRAAFKSQMQDLAEEQERQKAEMQAEEAREQFESLSPEEQVAVMQNAEAQEQQAAEEEAMMQEQTAQEQAMQEQAAMQGQPTEEQMMQEQMMAQQQGMIPQQPMGMEAQMGGYAEGGQLGNEYAMGGNLFFAGGDKEQDSDLSKAFFDRALDKWEKDNGRKASDTAKAALWKIAKANRKRFSKKPFGSKNEYWNINRLIKSLTANSLGEYEGDAYAKYKIFRDAGATEDDYYFLYPYQYVGTSAEKRYKDRNDAYKYLWETRLNKTYAPKNSIPDVIVTGKKGNKQPNNSEQKTGKTVVPVNNSSAQTESIKNSSQKDTAQQIFSYLKGVLTPEQYNRVKNSKTVKDAIAAHIRSGKSAEQFINAYNKRVAAKEGQPTVNDAVAAVSEASGTLTLTPQDIQDAYMQGYPPVTGNTGNTGNYAPTNYSTASGGYYRAPAAAQPTIPNMPPVYTDENGQRMVLTNQGMVPVEAYMNYQQALQERAAVATVAQPAEQVTAITPYDENTIGNIMTKTLGLNTSGDLMNWLKENKIGDPNIWDTQKPLGAAEWKDIIQNPNFIKALAEKDSALADVISKRNYDFGEYRPEETGEIIDINRGNWKTSGSNRSGGIKGLIEGWKDSKDPIWNEIKDKVGDAKTLEDIEKLMMGTKAWQDTTRYLQESPEHMLAYLQAIQNTEDAPDEAKAHYAPYVNVGEDNKLSWKDNYGNMKAIDLYNEIFNNNKTNNVRHKFPGSYWHSYSPALRGMRTVNMVKNANGEWEPALNNNVGEGWKETNRYRWNTPEEGLEYVYWNTPEQIAAAAEQAKANAKTGDAAKEEAPARDVVPVTRSEWPRYAGLFGPAVGLGMMAAGIGKPNLKDYEAALEIANGGASLASYMPIGNYLKYQPMDIWAQQNRMDANSRATDRAILNNSSPVGTRNAGLLANSYNSQLGSGELYRNALQYNDQLMQGVGTFNRATDMFNAEAFNRASATNAEIRNRDRQLRAQIGLQTAAEKAAANAGWYNSLYGNVAGLFKGFSDLGRENAQRNMIAKLAAAGAFGTLTPENAVGAGLVEWADEANKKKKKNWLSIFD